MASPNASTRSLEALVASHEDRVQRVEEQVNMLTSGTAQLGTSVQFMQQSLSNLDNKLDALGEAMKDHGLASAVRQDKILAEVNVLQDEKVASDARWALARKAILPASIIVTAGLVKFGEAAWAWIFGG